MRNLFALLFVIWFFIACSSDDKEIEEINYFPPSIFGVWESGNYFVSFNMDGSYSAYIADEFIDSGSYTKSMNVVSSQNTYFSRETIYTIKSITDTKLNVDISYTNLSGEKKNKTMTFIKSSTPPTSRTNTLEGKSYTSQSSSFGIITTRFTTSNSGIKSATKGTAAKYPLKFFYIYIGNKLYFQTLEETSIQVPTIGSWSTGYNTVKCWRLFFTDSGSINKIEIISL